jgi:hypothetical protein
MVFDPQAQTYDLYEIKSATSVKKINLYDVTFQRLVCEASIPVRNVYIVHVHRDYVRQGEIDHDQFFVIEDVTNQVDDLKAEVARMREDAWTVAKSESPDGILDCVKPKTCPCIQLCHPELPEYPIYDIPRLREGKARDLKERGILAIEEIPDDYPLSDRQRKNVVAVKSGKPFIDINAIENKLAQLEYPLYFLDYETFNPGRPYYDGYRPFQHIVFQYSLHVFDSPKSKPCHFEFLFTEQGDPGIHLVEDLAKHIGETGSVVVWHKPFESERNKELAGMYPEHQAVLHNINDRIFDLMEIFSKGHYIHADFHGSSSIKKVLPVLVEDYEERYTDLPIPKGDEAMMAWLEIMSGVFSLEEAKNIKQDLLRYCEMDTIAMVKNWEALENLITGTG